MANPYGALFAAPGARAFTAAGFVSRMPLSMTGIGLITMLSELRGQYGVAGAVAATFTLAMALIGPQVSRLVDRYGQGRVLLPVTGVSVVALGLLLLCAHYDAPVWTLFALAALAGSMPSMAAMVRARWTEIYRDSPRLHTAYALEAVIEDVTFIAGPALSVLLCTTLFPEAGPLVAGALLAVGVTLFVMRRDTEPPARGTAQTVEGSALRDGSLRVLVLALVAGGAIVGTVDVVSVAFADEQGQPGATGLVLAVYAVGSCAAGLAFGAVTLRTPLPRLLVLSILGTAATTLPFLLVNSVIGLTVAVFFAGVFFSPTMITIMNLIERIVPAHRLTEGMTWATTGLAIGVALGSSLSGAAVDVFGPRGGFAVAITAGALCVAVAALGYRPLVAAVSARPVTPPPGGDFAPKAGQGAAPGGDGGTVTVAAATDRTDADLESAQRDADLADGATVTHHGPDATGRGVAGADRAGADRAGADRAGGAGAVLAGSGASDPASPVDSAAHASREADERQQCYVDCG
ncbi:MFS transporter [Streptomyces sp. 71268]|uniref:MFS transporter n=1 Tax=Streptomyces sp. 71268 TaxID=3002640 RepID=UPI0023F8C5F3|nr:MFS transporter [Streptomyces sp. 71268]WEV27678.1 MFS transporter [Streptomyces sp. 71268]